MQNSSKVHDISGLVLCFMSVIFHWHTHILKDFQGRQNSQSGSETTWYIYTNLIRVITNMIKYCNIISCRSSFTKWKWMLLSLWGCNHGALKGEQGNGEIRKEQGDSLSIIRTCMKFESRIPGLFEIWIQNSWSPNLHPLQSPTTILLLSCLLKYSTECVEWDEAWLKPRLLKQFTQLGVICPFSDTTLRAEGVNNEKMFERIWSAILW